jgi:hypothetical protein
MKKIVRLTESDLARIVKRVIMEKSDEHIVYNYFKIVDYDGDVVGVGAVEVGSKNESSMIDDIFNLGYKPVKITKQEFEEYDGDEISNF